MASSFIFDPSQGETADSVTRRRQVADALAARIFSRTPQNLGEGINAIGQALIAAKMTNDADADQSGLNAYDGGLRAQLAAALSGSSPAAAAPSMAPASPAVVPNDSNAMPGTVGMNMALADRAQDFIQDNPGTSMSSGVRTPQQQAALYADRANNPNPVAPPGTSHHETGNAIDIAGMTPEQRTMLPQYGLGQPVANDPPHVELAPNQQPYQVAGPAVAAPQAPVPSAAPVAGAPQLGAIAMDPRASKETRAVASLLLKQQMEKQAQASDPMRALDIESKKLGIAKLQRELQGDGAVPLTPQERVSYGIPEQQPAYKTRTGEVKFGPAGTKITNNVGDAESSFSKEAGKVTAQRFNDLVSDGQSSRQMMSDMNTLLDLGKNIGTGKGAQVKAALGPFADAMGLKVEGLSDIQAYEAIVNRMAPALRVKGSGSQSDTELRNFLRSLPSLGNTTEGNEISVSVMKGLTQNKVIASEIASKALSGEITRTEAEKQLRELPDPMQPYRDYKAKRSKVDNLLEKYGGSR